MHPPTWVCLQTDVNVRHHALLLILVQPSLHIKPPQGIRHIHIWICDVSMSKCMGMRHFSFCLLLLQCLLLGASLTVEYPSKSAPPLSGEEGGESTPCPHPVSSAGPVLTAADGVLPTNSRVESDLLEARLETSMPRYSVLDRCLHLSDATIAWHQPSASGIGLTAKCVEWEIHSKNASPM